MPKSFIRFAALFYPLALTLAQAPNTVIRIDVNMVQVDAVVTDSHGKRVPELGSQVFEVLQDGKPQTITNFSYVSAKPDAGLVQRAALAAPGKPSVKGEIPAPPAVLRPTEVRRTLALVVDDLGLAGENVPRVRGAIKKFIDDDMRPGDMVAIVRTGAGMGALQQFTSDKRLLYAALERVKYTESRVGISSFEPLGSGGRGRGFAALNEIREKTLAMGTLGALRFVVNGMRGFPGRKSVILFTENIRLIFQGTTDAMVSAAVQQLTDAASRSSVVIHAVDPRGVPDFNITAADNTSRMSSRRVSRVPAQREEQVMRTEEGMFVLAEQTGGLFLHDTNDLAGALRKAAEDSDSYYLIGYHPDADTFENPNGQPKFHKIEVRLKTAGLHVRSRNGFFGEPGAGDRPLEHTRQAELAQALQSPLNGGSIHPRLTAVFSNLAKGGSFINALLYFNPNELKWSTEPDGSHKAVIDVAAAAFDENGVSLAPVDTTFTMEMKAENYAAGLQKGMTYGIHVPVSKPGPYLVRAALRDTANEQTGSADQFVEVPDVDSGRLAVSGIVVLQVTTPAPGDSAPKAQPETQGPSQAQDDSGGGASRRFRKGAPLSYFYEIINAKPGAGQRPEVEVLTRLYREGVQVVASKSPLSVAEKPADLQRLPAGGRITLGRDMKPGEYVLQVVVTDKLAKKFNVATQSMDFEIEQ